ncbi:hypothetical protein PUN28_019956 [Cardiocondyla obscurior]|uniref:Uncharacterized protein n=1 Tax=Cardiocondyla obscurior TaxID=286306 RepID=A0AAW2EC62_9HYME
MEHSGALTYRRCVTIVVHNYGCNWCNGVHREPRARLRNRINYLRVNYTTAAAPNEIAATAGLFFIRLSAKGKLLLRDTKQKLFFSSHAITLSSGLYFFFLYFVRRINM